MFVVQTTFKFETYLDFPIDCNCVLFWTLMKNVNVVGTGPLPERRSLEKKENNSNPMQQRLFHTSVQPHPTLDKQTAWNIQLKQYLTKL